MSYIRNSMERYWLHEPNVKDGGGPTRVEVGDPDPKFKPRPVGFTAQLEPVEVEPQTWDGDGA